MVERNASKRLWARVDRSAGEAACWPWRGSTIRGYGQIRVSAHDAPRQMKKTHRFAYELANGAIPDGMLVCHTCDNPPCCNPAHLFLGTAADNIADMVAKNRQARGAILAAARRQVHGEHVGTAKYNAAVVREVRRAHAAHEGSYRVLAARYGIPKGTIGAIITGKAWAHVA